MRTLPGERAAARGLLAVAADDIERYGRTASGMLDLAFIAMGLGRVSAAKVPLADAAETTIAAHRHWPNLPPSVPPAAGPGIWRW